MAQKTVRSLRIAIASEQSASFCQHHHVRKLSLFGSVLRDVFAQDSDIDVLVEFEPGKTPGRAIVQMARELSAMLGNRTIDLRTPKELSRYFRDRVITEALPLYEQIG